MSRAPDPDIQPHTDTAVVPTTEHSLSPPQAAALLSSFTNFLTVAVHSILYYRKLYPEATFLTARAYNLPVHQSRHPGVCSWIRDAVAAVGVQIRSGSARQVALVIHAADSFDVVERWIFDLQSFPATWGDRETFSGPVDAAGGGDDAVNWTDINESLRGALSKISLAGQSRPDLPEGCTFTLGVELRDQAVAPIHVSLRLPNPHRVMKCRDPLTWLLRSQHPQLWIPAQPSLQTPTENRPELGRDVGGTATTPIRSVQAGPLFFECWIEQGKLEPTTTAPVASFLSTLDTSRDRPEATASSSS